MEEKGKIPQLGKNELGKLLDGLSEDQKREEVRCRAILLEALAELKKADSKSLDKAEVLGQELERYQIAIKGQRNLGKVLKALGLDKSTLYRARSAWKVGQISGMRLAAENKGIDLSHRESEKLANRILKERKSDKGSKMSAVDLLAFCRKAIEDEFEAGIVQGVEKESGPMPDDEVNSLGLKPDTEKLLARFLEMFKDEAEGMMQAWLEQKLKGNE